MTQAVLAWALWVSAGGRVNSGHLEQTYIAAYFTDQEECVRVQRFIDEHRTKWSQCIQAHYLVTSTSVGVK